MKFNHLNVPTHWQNYWTRYPEGHTILEALISWVSQVDSMVDNVNDWNMYLDGFVSQFDTELQNTLTTILTDWEKSGFLDIVINAALQWQLDDYIVTNEEDKLSIGAQVQQKVGLGKKAELEDLSADVLSAIEGGEGTTFNLLSIPQDNSVTPTKTTFAVETNPNLFKLENVADGVLDITTGNINQSDNYVTSDYMFVLPGKVYEVTYLYVASFYNGTTFISSFNTVGAKELTVPANANRVRLSLRKDYTGYNTYSFKLKNVLNNVRIDRLAVDREHLLPESVTADALAYKSVSLDKASFIKLGTNLFDKLNVLKNKNLQDNALSDTNGFNVSDYIVGAPGKTYTFDRFRKIATYDKYKNQKRYIDNTANVLMEVTLDPGEVYMRGSVSDAIIDGVMIYEGVGLKPYEPYSLTLDNKITVPSVNNVKGLKGVAIGDSIVAGATYPGNVSARLDTTYTKVGFNGTRLMRNTFESPQSQLNLCSIVDAVVSDNWAVLDNAVAEIGGNTIPDLATLKTIDFNTLDYLTIAYGANDSGTVGTYNALGDINSSDTYTFHGAINYVITQLLTNFPHLKIHLFTPLYRSTTGYDTKPLADALKEQHEKWSVGLLDLHHVSMFNALTVNHYTTDGTHPNEKGNDVLDKLIGGYLSTH